MEKLEENNVNLEIKKTEIVEEKEYLDNPIKEELKETDKKEDKKETKHSKPKSYLPKFKPKVEGKDFIERKNEQTLLNIQKGFKLIIKDNLYTIKEVNKNNKVIKLKESNYEIDKTNIHLVKFHIKLPILLISSSNNKIYELEYQVNLNWTFNDFLFSLAFYLDVPKGILNMILNEEANEKKFYQSRINEFYTPDLNKLKIAVLIIDKLISLSFNHKSLCGNLDKAWFHPNSSSNKNLSNILIFEKNIILKSFIIPATNIDKFTFYEIDINPNDFLLDKPPKNTDKLENYERDNDKLAYSYDFDRINKNINDMLKKDNICKTVFKCSDIKEAELKKEMDVSPNELNKDFNSSICRRLPITKNFHGNEGLRVSTNKIYYLIFNVKHNQRFNVYKLNDHSQSTFEFSSNDSDLLETFDEMKKLVHICTKPSIYLAVNGLEFKQCSNIS